MDIAALEELRAVAAELGADPLLVQGAGGNASVKIGDGLWVKASGTWMRDAQLHNVFAQVCLAPLLALRVNGDFEAMMRGLGCAWAALPYATCGQSRKSLSATMNYYRSALAVYGGASSSNLPPQGSAKLAPTTGALLGGGAGLLVLLAAIYAISD